MNSFLPRTTFLAFTSQHHTNHHGTQRYESTRPTCSARRSLYREILSPLDENKKKHLKKIKTTKLINSLSLALPAIHRPRHHPRSRTDHRRRHRPRPLVSQPGQHGRSPPRSPPGALDGAGHFSAIVEPGSGVGDFSHGYVS